MKINIDQMADNFWANLRKNGCPPCKATEYVRRVCAYLRECGKQGLDPYKKESKERFFNSKKRKPSTQSLYNQAIELFLNLEREKSGVKFRL